MVLFNDVNRRTRKISVIKMVSFFDTFGLWNGHKISGGSLLLYISIMFYFLSQAKSKLRLFEPTRVNDSYLAPAL